MSTEIQMKTADYSSSQTANTNQESVSAPKSYSTVLSTQHFPSREQAIIFPALEETRLQDYLLPLGSIIEPKNILFSSRLSNQRICMYLKSKEIVENFMENHGAIEVKGQCLRARRLVTPAERLVLSNVCPTIPHQLLADELNKLQLNLISPITFLRINSNLPEYSHILSFRRQVYVSSHSISLPESILVTYEETPYRIFLSQDIICYNCKKHGHIASKCTENLPQTEGVENSSKQINPTTAKNKPTEESQTNIPHSNIGKRSVNEILTPPSNSNITSELDLFTRPGNNTQNKKFRSDKSNTELLTPAKAIIENLSPPVLNFEQTVALFDNIHGSPDPISIVKEYTNNFLGLLNLLESIYPLLSERSIKARCTKLKKKLTNLIGDMGTDVESDTSSQECY